MERRHRPTRLLLAALPALALLASGCAGPAVEPSSGHPDLVLISVDTLNRGALSAFDPAAGPLPVLDQLSERSRRFTEAHSVASWTLPSHGSMLTGVYPDRHGGIAGGRSLSPDVPLLAECLQAAGFETAGFTDGGFLHHKFGFDRGFDVYDDSSTARRRGQDPALGGEPKERRTGRIFRRAMAFLSGRPQRPDKPLFLFAHTYVVHDYFKAHPWALERVAEFPDKDRRAYRHCQTRIDACSAEEWQRLEDLYRAEVEHLDDRLGMLLAALKAAGYDESTYVVLLADHGEGFDPEHGRIHHGGRVHADVVRIPMLVAGPGVEPGDDPRPVSLVDVTPTVAELLGVDCTPPGQGFDGVSFASSLRPGAGEPPVRRTLFAMEHSHLWPDGVKTALDPVPRVPALLAAMRGDRWYIGGAAGEELYDMESDPEQFHNLAPDAPETKGFREELRGQLSREAPETERAADDELERQLRSLGYL